MLRILYLYVLGCESKTQSCLFYLSLCKSGLVCMCRSNNKYVDLSYIMCRYKVLKKVSYI